MCTQSSLSLCSIESDFEERMARNSFDFQEHLSLLQERVRVEQERAYASKEKARRSNMKASGWEKLRVAWCVSAAYLICWFLGLRSHAPSTKSPSDAWHSFSAYMCVHKAFRVSQILSGSPLLLTPNYEYHSRAQHHRLPCQRTLAIVHNFCSSDISFFESFYPLPPPTTNVRTKMSTSQWMSAN